LAEVLSAVQQVRARTHEDRLFVTLCVVSVVLDRTRGEAALPGICRCCCYLGR
jgi:hypothetical protein